MSSNNDGEDGPAAKRPAGMYASSGSSTHKTIEPRITADAGPSTSQTEATPRSSARDELRAALDQPVAVDIENTDQHSDTSVHMDFEDAKSKNQ